MDLNLAVAAVGSSYGGEVRKCGRSRGQLLRWHGLEMRLQPWAAPTVVVAGVGAPHGRDTAMHGLRQRTSVRQLADDGPAAGDGFGDELAPGRDAGLVDRLRVAGNQRVPYRQVLAFRQQAVGTG